MTIRGRPFQKGQSGNPRGRPKRGAALTDFARWAVLQTAGPDDRRTRGQALAEALVSKAIEGDVTAIKLLFDRLDGPVPQVLTGEGGGPIRIAWPWEDAAVAEPPDPIITVNGATHGELPAP